MLKTSRELQGSCSLGFWVVELHEADCHEGGTPPHVAPGFLSGLVDGDLPVQRPVPAVLW